MAMSDFQPDLERPVAIFGSVVTSKKMKKTPSCFTISLTGEQVELLRHALSKTCWEFSDGDYCHFKAKKEKTSLSMYRSGKLVVQGTGTTDFVEFVLEPLVLKRCLEKFPEAEAFTPHAGIDESGKGDFFGPLVIACAYVGTKEQADKLRTAGVRDSKQIKTDAAILKIAGEIRQILCGKIGLIAIGPEAYNRLYASMGNLNRLLAWGHARALENLLELVPDCQEAIADQFGSEHLIRNALMTRGRQIHLIQRTRAESDMAVGAASILARAEFVRRMDALSSSSGRSVPLPRGAGPAVDSAAREIAAEGGREALSRVAKMHFRTAAKVLGTGDLFGSEN